MPPWTLSIFFFYHCLSPQMYRTDHICARLSVYPTWSRCGLNFDRIIKEIRKGKSGFQSCPHLGIVNVRIYGIMPLLHRLFVTVPRTSSVKACRRWRCPTGYCLYRYIQIIIHFLILNYIVVVSEIIHLYLLLIYGCTQEYSTDTKMKVKGNQVVPKGNQ